jgi:hypothetical protein
MFANAFLHKQWADLRALDAVPRWMPRSHRPLVCLPAVQSHADRGRAVSRPAAGPAAPHAATNSAQLPPLEELAERLQASDNWFGEYVATLAPACREEIIHFDFADGQAGSMSREEILFHILNHGTYHRGAIGHALERPAHSARRIPILFSFMLHSQSEDSLNRLMPVA